MFKTLEKKYGVGNDVDLNDLTRSLEECKLTSRRKNPEDWYAQLDHINGQIKGIECCPKQGESFLSNFSKGNVTRLCIKGATQCSSFRKSSLIRDFYLSFYLPTKQNFDYLISGYK